MVLLAQYCHARTKTKQYLRHADRTRLGYRRDRARAAAPWRYGYDGRMDAFLISAGIVALAEMGDKTQLLALVLAARFRRPWPIVGGILVATIVNHALAGAVGAWVANAAGPDMLRWALGGSFVAMGLWMLVPDKLDQTNESGGPARLGVFGTTVLAFFLAEMGDKTQVATVMLVLQYQAYFSVVAGTTLGMMLANAPVVWLGERVTRLLPMRMVHMASAAIFVGMGAAALIGWR